MQLGTEPVTPLATAGKLSCGAIAGCFIRAARPAAWLLLSALAVPAHAQMATDGVCGRTEQVRNAIVAAVSGASDCASVTAEQLGQIGTLSLFADGIAALQADDFAGLTGLTDLSLAYNSLQALPPGVFDGLTRLETLWLNNNLLQQLPAGVFAGLTALSDLRLQGNAGYPFGPTASAGVSRTVDAGSTVALAGSGGDDPWGREVTYAWTQTDSSGVSVAVDGADTLTPTVTAPAEAAEIRLTLTLTVAAVNPGGTAPPGSVSTADVAQDIVKIRVLAAHPVSASFVTTSSTATEGGSPARLTIRLNAIPRRTVTIPLTATPAGGADTGDYLAPTSVTFGYVDRERILTVTAIDDDVDDDGESVVLGFGESLPGAVSVGTHATATVTLADNDEPVGTSITAITITSDPGPDATYRVGDTIRVTVTFSDSVTVSGMPRLKLLVGTRITALLGLAGRLAEYESGTGSQHLVFAYTPVAGDNDPDGVSIAADSLSLNGGSIGNGNGAPALLTHRAVSPQSGHRVDCLAPALSDIYVDGAELTIRYTEALDAASVPAAAAFQVYVGGARRTGGAVGVNDRFVTLALAPAVLPGETVTASYTVPAVNPIRDQAGLRAAGFDEDVPNETLPTISITALAPVVYEGEEVDFTLARTGPTTEPLTVYVDVEDWGDVLDEAEGSREVTFAVGDSTAPLWLATWDDLDYEPHTVVAATVDEAWYYVVSESAESASVTVRDNDLPEIDVTLAAPERVVEHIGRFTVLITATTVSEGLPHRDFVVLIRSTVGTAVSGADGDFIAVSEEVRFRIEQFSGIEVGGAQRYVATVATEVTIHEDGMLEEDETFTLRLKHPGGIRRYNLPGDPSVITILDDDIAGGTESVFVTPAIISEGEHATVTVAPANAPFATDQTVTLAFASHDGDDVTPGVDYTVFADGTTLSHRNRTLANHVAFTSPQPHYDLTLPAGWTSIVATVAAADDDDAECHEMIYLLAFHDGERINRKPQRSDTLAIRSSDLRPELDNAVIDGNTVTLTFNRRLRHVTQPPDTHPYDLYPAHLYFSLYTGPDRPGYNRHGVPQPRPDQYAETFSLSGRQVVLTFAEPVAADETVWVAYDQLSKYAPLGDGSDGSCGLGVSSFITQAANATPASVRSGVADAMPALRVTDAGAREGSDATLDFAVTLDRATDATVTLAFATADGTATAGADYTATSGRLIFTPGETERTVAVTVLDDAHDEGEETFTLHLSNAGGARLADAAATGTIVNRDPLPRAWLARFGRTVAGHVLDAVGARLAAPRAESQATLARHRLGGTAAAVPTPETREAFEHFWEERLHAGRQRDEPRTLQLAELFNGSSFDLSAGAPRAPSYGIADRGRWTVWGRGAWSRFAGADGDLSLAGEVLTATVGADYERGRLLTGLAVAYSSADGTYEHSASGDSGTLTTALLGVHPYLRLTLHEHLAVWGLLGYAPFGSLTWDAASAGQVDAGTGMLMAAFGVRGTLLPAAATGGFELAAATDGLLLRMRSEAAADLVATAAEVQRLRLLLRASQHAAPLAGGLLTSAIEVGGRYDGGDAETGAGLVLGGSLGYTLPAWGLTLTVSGRGLLLHESAAFREWGVGGSLQLDPGTPGRGAALRVAPSWGATGGMSAATLWALPDAARLAAHAADQSQPGARLTAELSFGLDAPGESGALTPYAGLTVAGGDTLTWRLGSRLRIDPGISLSLEVSGRDHAVNDSEPRVALRGAVRY